MYEDLVAILITILISSGVLGGAYIYFKDKLKYIGQVVSYIGAILIYLHTALEDDKLTKEEITQLIVQLEELVKLIEKLL